MLKIRSSNIINIIKGHLGVDLSSREAVVYYLKNCVGIQKVTDSVLYDELIKVVEDLNKQQPSAFLASYLLAVDKLNIDTVIHALYMLQVYDSATGKYLPGWNKDNIYLRSEKTGGRM